MKMLATVLAVCALGVSGPMMARDFGGHHGGAGFSGGHAHSFSGHSSGHGFVHHRGFGHDHLGFDVGVGVGGWPYYYDDYGPFVYGVPYEDDYAAPVYSDDGTSVAAEVQLILAKRGYYHGDVDGVIGPMSQDAIARYQANHGLAVTGVIDGGLLNSLGIR